MQPSLLMRALQPTKKRTTMALAWVFLLISSAAAQVLDAPSAPLATQQEPASNLRFEQWKTACERLPRNRELNGRLPAKELLPLAKYADLEKVVLSFLEQAKNGVLSQRTNWVGQFPEAGFFETDKAYFLKANPRLAAPFQPFAQVLNVPAGSEVYFRGDLHGDVHSLLANLTWLNEQGYLKGFEINRPNFFMVFLGDFTDRGMYGIEVLYTVFRLKLANPDRVFLLRGNHEEVSLVARYGFFEEGRGKYGPEFNPVKLLRAYEFFPAVLYVGSGGNYLQANHGGMEPGYNPHQLLGELSNVRFQLLGALKQKEFLQNYPEWFGPADKAPRALAANALHDFNPVDPNSPSVLGFLWNDFTVFRGEPEFAVDPGRAFVYGQRTTQFLLRQAGKGTNQVHAVFRGHQHASTPNPLMRRLVASRGLFEHWQENDSLGLQNAPVLALESKLTRTEERSIPPGSVWTFNVSPDSAYGAGNGYSFDAFGLLRVGERFTDWKVRVVNVQVPAASR